MKFDVAGTFQIFPGFAIRSHDIWLGDAKYKIGTISWLNDSYTVEIPAQPTQEAADHLTKQLSVHGHDYQVPVAS
jgi:hypothetical protein